MNKIGMLEFKAQFPLLFEEYNRRLEFETYAMYYIFDKRDGADCRPTERRVNSAGRTRKDI